MTSHAGTLILGAGQAGAQLALSLRQGGYDRPIVLAGDEPWPPYQRPPLSKDYLLGELTADHLDLRTQDAWREAGVEMKLGLRAAAIDRSAKTVAFDGGESLAYDTLVLALGARAKTLTLAGADLSGVVTLRTRDDADALRPALQAAQGVVVIGGGYIGLEIAAAARKFSRPVTVLEAAPRLMSRTSGPTISDFYAAEHRAHGVDVRLSTPPVGFVGEDAVRAVRLANGDVIDADLVIIGVGAKPNDEIAATAGLACQDGVVVDAQGRTDDPAIFAIGDVARGVNPIYGRPMRLESVQNAIDGAKAAAAAILGADPPRAHAPWNWSDQYDLKLQIAGAAQSFEHEVVR
ncbi:MAG: FAD-dependent oxidoreductase, partial [Maricaulaceae bacterium]